jgi:serine/threonine-protein kinase
MEMCSEELPFRMQPGERFAGKYLIQRVLGTGGMGVVVAALHEQLGQTVAIKLLSVAKNVQPEGISRFLREARAAAALHSEHVARVVDVDVDETGRHYIVMERLEGRDLSAITSRGERPPVITSVGYILQACEAIAEAHSLGIVHRDLKPGNLFLSRRLDGSPFIKVLDFGISKFAESEGLQSGDAGSLSSGPILLGTPSYMSPEQVRTPLAVDGRSDVWALGVILFQLLTGELPFAGTTVADIIAAILTVVPPTPSALRRELPEELSAVVVASLRKDPNQRISSVGRLAERLRPWAPRWALDAAVRATRIAGIGSAAIDDSGLFPPLAAPRSISASAPAPARARVSLAVAEIPEDRDPNPRDPVPNVGRRAAAPPSSPGRRSTRLAIGGGALVGAALLVSLALLARPRAPSPATGETEPDRPQPAQVAASRVAAPPPPGRSEAAGTPAPALASPRGSGRDQGMAPASPSPRSGVASPPTDLGAGAPDPELPSVAVKGARDRAQGVRRAGAAGPKHPSPVSFESVIHMGPRSPNGTPKREIVRSGAPTNWSAPSSDPLDSRR